MEDIIENDELTKEFIEARALIYSESLNKLPPKKRRLMKQVDAVMKKGIDKFLNCRGRSVEIECDGTKMVTEIIKIGYKFSSDMFLIRCKNGVGFGFQNCAFSAFGMSDEFSGIPTGKGKKFSFRFL